MPRKKVPKRPANQREVSRYLGGVSLPTIKNWENDPDLKFPRGEVVGGNGVEMVYDLDLIDAWLRVDLVVKKFNSNGAYKRVKAGAQIARCINRTNTKRGIIRATNNKAVA